MSSAGYILKNPAEVNSVTHLRSNHTWRTRWASLALESLCILDKNINNSHHTVATTTAVALSWIYLQSLLSVQDVRAVRLFLEVPEVHIETTVSTATFSDVVMLSIDFKLTGGPFGPGKPVGP